MVKPRVNKIIPEFILGAILSITRFCIFTTAFFNPIQDGLFWGCSRMRAEGGGKKAPFPKICHTYPAMMKRGTVIPYLKRIQKIYESRDKFYEFC